MMNRKTTDLMGLAFWIVLTFSVAAFASQFEPGAWYKTIAKPPWTPPGWLFGPVWGMLYLAMSVSAWLIWRQRTTVKVIVPLTLYLLQLALNGLWSWLFFGRQLIGTALIDLIVLVLLIGLTTAMFMRIRKQAGFMMLAYLLWVSFATALNFQIWRLN
jgi:tryptophan-rich sensory protein